MIELSDITVRHHGQIVLEHFSAKIAPGTCVCLKGNSELSVALLHVLLGETAVTAGTATVDGVDIATLPRTLLQHYRRNVGALYKDSELFPQCSAASSIAIALQARHVSSGEIPAAVTTLLQKTGLQDKAMTSVEDLAEGEKRRLLLAHALAGSPKILLLEEPTEGVDTRSATIIHRLLKAAKSNGKTIVIATQNPQEFSSLCDQVIAIEKKKEAVASHFSITPQSQ